MDITKFNKSIILLFHGTSNYKESEETYDNITNKFKDVFKDFYITKAYSSSAIREMSSNVDFVSIEDRLKELKNKNIKEVYIAPIVVIQNKDYVKGLHTVSKFKNDYSTIKYGESLLSVPSDYDNMVKIIKEEYKDKDYTYLFVGHGGKHHSNSAYGMLGYKLILENESYITITFSKSIDVKEVENKLKKLNKKVLIIPILISKSFHYKKDISEKVFNAVRDFGLEAEIINMTLGEWEPFINLCVNKTKKLING